MPFEVKIETVKVTHRDFMTPCSVPQGLWDFAKYLAAHCSECDPETFARYIQYFGENHNVKELTTLFKAAFESVAIHPLEELND